MVCRRNYVCHQALVARRILPGDYCRLRHCGIAQQRRLDFTRLNSESTNFHLIVHAADIFQHTVAAPARQVARLIHAAARHAEWIGHEALGRQCRLVEIAPCHAGPGDIELPGDSDGDRFQAVVQNMKLRVPDRHADRYRLVDRIAGANFVHRTADDCLRRSVFIDQPRFRTFATPRVDGGAMQGLAADDKAARQPAEVAGWESVGL